ncbi:hypothetical protein CLOM_g3942 [Closterium sp. NIES-68]|nr:hypothetical protein CLOM_g3942 [Closterium sp. NIES-68]GJP83663.1 hypothetical protein CLOP_g13792 [Closterium sp. NIES-67]
MMSCDKGTPPVWLPSRYQPSLLSARRPLLTAFLHLSLSDVRRGVARARTGEELSLLLCVRKVGGERAGRTLAM